MKRMRSKQQAKTARDGGGVLVNPTGSIYFPQAGDNSRKAKFQESPLILINGSIIVGKSAIARDMAYILANKYPSHTAKCGKQVVPPPGGPVEAYIDGRIVVLHMNEMYHATYNTTPKSDDTGKASSAKSKPSTNKGLEHCDLWPGTETSTVMKQMQEVRNKALLDFVVPEEQENKIVIITDCMYYSKESAESIQEYRIAARVTGRPFVHIYLTCSLDEHIQRLDHRATARVCRPKCDEKKKRKKNDKGKGKEKVEVGELCEKFSTELLEKLRHDIRAMDVEESKWLPALFPAKRRPPCVGSSSTTSRKSQFRGRLIDTTFMSAYETATSIAGLVEDIRNGIKSCDMGDTEISNDEGENAGAYYGGSRAAYTGV